TDVCHLAPLLSECLKGHSRNRLPCRLGAWPMIGPTSERGVESLAWMKLSRRTLLLGMNLTPVDGVSCSFDAWRAMPSLSIRRAVGRESTDSSSGSSAITPRHPGHELFPQAALTRTTTSCGTPGSSLIRRAGASSTASTSRSAHLTDACVGS